MNDLNITLNIGWLVHGLLTATGWLIWRGLDLLLSFYIFVVLVKGYYKINPRAKPKDKSKDNPSDNPSINS